MVYGRQGRYLTVVLVLASHHASAFFAPVCRLQSTLPSAPGSETSPRPSGKWPPSRDAAPVRQRAGPSPPAWRRCGRYQAFGPDRRSAPERRPYVVTLQNLEAIERQEFLLHFEVAPKAVEESQHLVAVHHPH